MRIHRIIVLQSVEDSVTYRRKLRMEQSPYLNAYEFEHCYAFELNEEQKALSTFQMMEQVEQALLNKNDLIKRLDKKIRDFKPDAYLKDMV